MHKISVFAGRNRKEILRDPQSYIFCLGFPMVMLILMTIINRSIPAEAGLELFAMKNLGPAMLVFGFCFTMLFMALLLSKDRCSAFLNRLYAAPMRAGQFIAGYILPVLELAILQGLITGLTAWVIGRIVGDPISAGGLLLAVIAMLPVMLMFICLGLLFGGLFSDKAAPGFSSIVITAAGILGGMWMDVASIGGVIETIARALPFYPAVQAARIAAEGGKMQDLLAALWLPTAYAAVCFVLAALIFRRNMTRDPR